MEKEAMFWKVLKEKRVQCQLCPHFCVLKNGGRGKCRVRENKDGKLISLVYSRACSFHSDPIEKKPLFHFLPGEKALSISTVGCNLSCRHCQNSEISQVNPEDVKSLRITPREVVEEAKENGIKIITYTFTDPVVFYEYMLDTAKLAKKEGIKNVAVTNGFINPEPLKKLCEYLDGVNVDLKSIDDDFYRQVCGAKLKPVLESLKIMKEKGVWIELTNLLIPGLNDSEKNIKELVNWVKKNLENEAPIHFSSFHPTYKMLNLSPTTEEKVKEARKIAIDEGMKFVYTGNIEDDEGSNTYCSKCGKVLIRRNFFGSVENKIGEKKVCTKCGEEIAGVWC